MDWTQAVFGSVLVSVLAVAAGVFGLLQLRALRKLTQDALPEEERRFARTQARRRLWGCALMALMAVILALELVFAEPAAQAMADQRERLAKEDAPKFTEVFAFKTCSRYARRGMGGTPIGTFNQGGGERR